MLAMTTKNSIRTGDSLGEEESTTETDRSPPAGGSMPLHSGLSALIQAATCQLHLLAEESTRMPREATGRVVTMTHSEDTASSDGGGEHLDAPTRTPTIVPEPDPRKQSFPELLMTLALEPSNIDVIAFLPDGKFFAIRSQEFSEDLMVHYFAVATFVEFLDLSQDWGFSRIFNDEETCSGIEVLRHPYFIKGDWERCNRIKFGESPTDARLSALPERARIEYTMSDDSVNSALQSKRRLSPGFLARRESETSVSSQKQKVDSDLSSSKATEQRRGSNADSEAPEGPYTNVSRTEDLRSIALSITTENLNIKGDVQEGPKKAPLVARAVESATHTIVTDAIETLLRDESHTKETYLKHEKELSRSSLPGVVPISTQLFSPSNEDSNVKAATVSASTVSPSVKSASRDGAESLSALSPSANTPRRDATTRDASTAVASPDETEVEKEAAAKEKD